MKLYVTVHRGPKRYGYGSRLLFVVRAGYTDRPGIYALRLERWTATNIKREERA